MPHRRFVLGSAAALATGVMLLAHRSHAAATPALSADERALHALNRLGYGPGRPMPRPSPPRAPAPGWSVSSTSSCSRAACLSPRR